MRQLFLTAGHNGPGTGANGVLDEGAETIKVRNELAKLFRSRNVFPKLDRDKDSLSKVISWINSNCNSEDLTLDLHFDSCSNPQATGTTVFIYEHTAEWVKDLAKMIASVTSEVLQIKNRGVLTDDKSARGSLAACRKTKCRGILLEICFCSNPSDVKRFQQFKLHWEYQLVDVIIKYLIKKV